jgi:hypothetical protein
MINDDATANARADAQAQDLRGTGRYYQSGQGHYQTPESQRPVQRAMVQGSHGRAHGAPSPPNGSRQLSEGYSSGGGGYGSEPRRAPGPRRTRTRSARRPSTPPSARSSTAGPTRPTAARSSRSSGSSRPRSPRSPRGPRAAQGLREGTRSRVTCKRSSMAWHSITWRASRRKPSR